MICFEVILLFRFMLISVFRCELAEIRAVFFFFWGGGGIFFTLEDEGDRGSTVVRVLCYKSEGRWFDPSWCQWIFH